MFDFKINRLKHQSIIAVFFTLVATINAAPSFAVTDPVVLTFSTVGDSRQDPEKPDSTVKQTVFPPMGCPVPSGTGLTATNPGLPGQDCKWLQNTKDWSRIMRAIQSQKANLLFFNGDMIMGYGKADVPVIRTSNGVGEAPFTSPTVDQIVNSDLMQFYQQYGFWRGMIATLMETGTYVVPVPGNHETQCKRCAKKAQQVNENAWRDNMGDLILDTTRFNSLLGTAPQNFDVINAPSLASDGLATDQKQLSYSFDVGASHFVVINTDPVGNDSHAPTNWLEADLSAAVGRGTKRIFVFGHKPAFYYMYSGATPTDATSSLDGDPANVPAAQAFWNVIAKYKATYFCGHEHIYKIDKFFSFDGNNNSAYQVLVGTGGSPFEAKAPSGTAYDSLHPNDRTYAWATVKIFQSGKVVMDTYGYLPTLNPNLPPNPIVKLETIQLPTW